MSKPVQKATEFLVSCLMTEVHGHLTWLWSAGIIWAFTIGTVLLISHSWVFIFISMILGIRKFLRYILAGHQMVFTWRPNSNFVVQRFFSDALIPDDYVKGGREGARAGVGGLEFDLKEIHAEQPSSKHLLWGYTNGKQSFIRPTFTLQGLNSVANNGQLDGQPSHMSESGILSWCFAMKAPQAYPKRERYPRNYCLSFNNMSREFEVKLTNFSLVSSWFQSEEVSTTQPSTLSNGETVVKVSHVFDVFSMAIRISLSAEIWLYHKGKSVLFIVNDSSSKLLAIQRVFLKMLDVRQNIKFLG